MNPVQGQAYMQTLLDPVERSRLVCLSVECPQIHVYSFIVRWIWNCVIARHQIQHS